MPNPTKVTLNDKHADYYSCHFLRELKESDPAAFSALRDGGKVYYTVFHEESDFSEPEFIRRGCGLVNRMGFLIGPQDFISGDILDLTDKRYRDLQDDLREAELKS